VTYHSAVRFFFPSKASLSVQASVTTPGMEHARLTTLCTRPKYSCLISYTLGTASYWCSPHGYVIINCMASSAAGFRFITPRHSGQGAT
jgi:hypothetical protein